MASFDTAHGYFGAKTPGTYVVGPQGGTFHVCIWGCACHVFESEISLESYIFRLSPRATPGDSHILVAPGVGLFLLCLPRRSAGGEG